MTTIRNLTPHPVTIVRASTTVTYPACDPADLPRATEGRSVPHTEEDGQDCHDRGLALHFTGVVDDIGYTGVDGLPLLVPVLPSEYLIVSVVTAIGALAAGRPIRDLLVPMGQMRGADGRIIGATSLAPAETLLAPMLRSVTMADRLELRAERTRAARLQDQSSVLAGQLVAAETLTSQLSYIIRHDGSPALLPDGM